MGIWPSHEAWLSRPPVLHRSLVGLERGIDPDLIPLGVAHGAPEPHREDEKSLLEDLCVLCALAVIFEGGALCAEGNALHHCRRARWTTRAASVSDQPSGISFSLAG
ncbi:MAG: hypothetical protein D6723_07415 [Acidobacteria bacterium]|nr:MAG: hypothetical protein D6723_07415 [Acidobacteriota bacterium]